MKKITMMIIVMMAMMMPAVANAQKLAGNWVCNDKSIFVDGEDDDDSKLQKAEVVLSFQNDGTMQMSFGCELGQQENGVNIDLGLKATIPGKYAKNGNQLSFALNKEDCVAEVTKLDIAVSPEIEEQLAAAGMSKESVIEMIKNSVNAEQFTKEFGNSFMHTFTYSFIDRNLVLTDDDSSITFVRR